MSSNDLDPKVIEKTARLAKLELTPKEISEFSAQLGQVLQNFKAISQIDTQGIEPLINPTESQIVLREDQVQVEFTVEELLNNAPEKQGNLFAVPPVV